jgi:hypothetical protein
VATVLTYVRYWGLAPTLDIRRITWKLVALFSRRWESDLTLLRVTPEFYQRTAKAAVFHPAFSAK